ncbi:MAG: hypothetical protein ABI333_01065 [bacterium]
MTLLRSILGLAALVLLGMGSPQALAQAAPPRKIRPTPAAQPAPRTPEAQPPPRAPERSVVMVAARNQAAASRELRLAVMGQLSDANVALELYWVDRFAASPPAQLALARQVAQGKRIVAVFWCDLVSKGETFLYLAEPGKGRIMVRSVARVGGGVDVAESVAIIVGMSVRALVKHGRSFAARPGPRRVVARGPVARRVTDPGDNPLYDEAAALEKKREVARRPLWLALEMLYSLDFYGSRQLASGTTYPPLNGASIGLVARFTPRWSVFVSYRVIEPIKAKGENAETSLQRHPLSLGARVRWRRGRWELSGGLSFTFDYVAEDTSAPELNVPNNGGMLQLLAGVEARVSFWAVGRLRILLALGAEVGLYTALYSIEKGDGDQPIVISPWPVRPYLRLGLAIDLF